MLSHEKKVFIEKLFDSQEIFEKNILDVKNKEDREEVLRILSKQIVRILLREELNFLYMDSLVDFKLSLIPNILFKELANEWVYYATENLAYSRSDAISEIKEKTKVGFLLKLAKKYYSEYGNYFYEEIADTFIELVDYMPNPTLNNELIKEVMQSKFVKKQNISVIHNYHQLWSRVKNAHNNKNKQVSKIQIKITEALANEDQKLVKKYEYDEEVLTEKSLAYFDEAVKRLRDNMLLYMMEMK